MKMILPVLADFANGIFATIIAGYATGTEVVWWHFVIGIGFAMSPDIDAIPELLRRGKVAASREHESDHRELLHYPIVFVVAGVLVFVYYPFWGALFLSATLFHFLNDLYGTGWGVSLFWPLTKDRFKLFTDSENIFSFTFRHAIRRIPHKDLAKEIHDHGMEDWIDEFYLKANPVSIVEYLVFAFALILLFYTLLY
jgi:hypothetical protein